MKIKTHYRFRFISSVIIAAVFIGASLSLIAWAGSPAHTTGKTALNKDTIPTKKQAADKDFDKELRQLDDAKKHLEELKNKNWDKVQLDIEEAMKKMDMEKISLQAEEAFKKVDMEKIAKEIEESLRKIDFNKIEKDMEAAMNEVSKIDKEQLKREMQKARLEVNEQLQKKEWRKEMEEVNKINIKEIQEEMEKAKKEMAGVKDELKWENLDMRKAMTGAHAEIDKSKEELKGYQEMIYAMEKDALLSTSKDYTIEYRQGQQLSINGKKQSTEILNKYKKYFKKGSVTIKKQKGDLKIDMD